MNMISVEKNIQSIAVASLNEANNLLRNNIVDDEFIRSAISDLKKLASSSHVSEDVFKRVSLLGLAAVRSYQSFDEIPATDKFVELSNDLSKAVAVTLGCP
jgi:hypothetical protein